MNRLTVKMGWLLCLFMLGAASAWACPEGPDRLLPVQELEEGFYNHYVTKKRYMLARTQGELEEVERLIGTSLDVDLEETMVVVAFMGNRNSGGYHIEVVRAVETGTSVEAHVQLTSPGPGCMVTLALTSPYQVVALPRVEDKELSIREREKTEYCR